MKSLNARWQLWLRLRPGESARTGNADAFTSACKSSLFGNQPSRKVASCDLVCSSLQKPRLENLETAVRTACMRYDWDIHRLIEQKAKKRGVQNDMSGV